MTAVTEDEAFQRALSALQAGDANEAERLFKEVLGAQPQHVPALNLLGIVLMGLGRFGEAETYLRAALGESATSDTTLYNYGIVLKALNRPVEALQRFTEALKINASVAETWNNRGTVLRDLKRHTEAIADFDRAISLNPNYTDAFYNKGNALADSKSYEQALTTYDRALGLKPDLAEAWLGRGNVFAELKQDDEAVAAYDKALVLKPLLAEAWLSRGNVLARGRQYDGAFAAYDKALTVKPDFAEAWLGRGNIYRELKQYDRATGAFDRALALKSDLIEAWLGRGTVWTELKRYDEALAAFDTAVALSPDSAKGWLGRGRVFTECGRHEDALAAYGRALALDPHLNYVAGARLEAKLYLCDWTCLEAESARLLAEVRELKPACFPFTFLTLPSLPADQLQCARCYVQDQPSYPAIWSGQIYSHDRIRVAYLSGDFNDHPIAYLTVGLFENHDKSRFEVTGLSFGPNDTSTIGRRIRGAFEHFIDAQDKSDEDIADLVRRLEIDIAVDLMGFIRNNRLNVLARRPAPIQINYIGYPGTMGAPYMDYIIADSTIIPEQHCVFYEEQVIWLPETFQINDHRKISEPAPTRHECGLPETAFVFCAFNHSYKIMPEIFEIWMRLLKDVEGSVLWLKVSGEIAPRNLRREAECRGVAPERLVFAPQVSRHADHLARYRQADLFLDTLPYNAHTTAGDALWAGVPVVTCLGRSFPGRIAASVVKSVGLKDLVTHSLQEYEALALKLAHNPVYLASIKAKLACNRLTFPLFNAERSTRQMEAAYTTVWERYQRGEMPRFRTGESKPIRFA
jgi:protein O-GlcNAc transferase